MPKVAIKNKRLILNLSGLSDELREEILKTTNRQSELLTNYIIERHLTGGTKKTKLAVRSGLLRKTTRPISSVSGERMKGGTRFGVFYAGPHIGPPNKVTTIKPRKAKSLAIPILYGLTAAGVAKAKSPRDVPGLKYIPRGSKSPLLAKVEGGTVKPWYVLKKEVKIKARVHPNEIIDANMPRILRAYELIIEESLRENL